MPTHMEVSQRKVIDLEFDVVYTRIKVIVRIEIGLLVSLSLEFVSWHQNINGMLMSPLRNFDGLPRFEGGRSP